jgi:hypothetical protein
VKVKQEEDRDARRWNLSPPPEKRRRWDKMGVDVKVEVKKEDDEVVVKMEEGERRSRWGATSDHDTRRRSPPRGDGRRDQKAFEPPPLFAILRGTVKRVAGEWLGVSAREPSCVCAPCLRKLMCLGGGGPAMILYGVHVVAMSSRVSEVQVFGGMLHSAPMPLQPNPHPKP